jgi:DNA gyrase subunit A
LRDIRTSDRNGKVIGTVRVQDDDEILLMTARGKIQRLVANEISVIGRNTQGVRLMSVDEEDSLIAVVGVPPEEALTEGTDAIEGATIEGATIEGDSAATPRPEVDEADAPEGPEPDAE